MKKLSIFGFTLILPNFAKAAALINFENTRLAMGTIVQISLRSSSKDQANEAFELAFNEINRLESLLSRYNSTSALSILNTQGSISDCPPELLYVLQSSNQMFLSTNKAYNISVAPLVDLYKKHKNIAGEMQISQAEINETQELISQGTLNLSKSKIKLEKSGQYLSLDGIAKGFIVDKTAELLKSLNIQNFLINAGGDIFVSGFREDNKTWTIALENPNGGYSQVLELTNCAIASSGNYQNYYDKDKKYHHIIDPESCSSPHHVQAASVIANSCMLADALATSFNILPSGKVQSISELFNCKNYII